MGRTARHQRPPPSGSIIFYGRTQSAVRHVAVLQNPVSLELSQSESTSAPLLSANFEERRESVRNVVLGLTAIISEVFKEVPYVKIVATIVQKIITISDEMKANKSRAKELVGKVLMYGRVVFEALLALDRQQMKDLSGIKEDLMQIASVFESVYDSLQHLCGAKSKSLLNRIVHREDIASQLEEHDRKLEMTITGFQLKSSIVLRSGVSFPFTDDDAYRKELRPSTTAFNVFPQALGLRAKPQILFGRDKEMNLIVNVMLTKTKDETQAANDPYPPRICILGSGGIGKTTLALSVLHHQQVVKKFGGDRFFVSCEAVTSSSDLLAQLALCLELPTEDLKDISLNAIIRRLEKKPSLVVLDNFETPWDDPYHRSEIESILSTLTSTKATSMILTMRGSQQPSGTRWSKIIPPLQPVDLNSAIAIFQAISGKSDQYAVSLIKAVDCVPLAVTLIATLSSVEGETTQLLWSRWQEESTSMVGNGADRLSSLETSVQLSLSSPRMQQDTGGALLLLRAISLLPDGISPQFLKACEDELPEIKVKKALSTLRQNALIYEDRNKDFRILSPIRLFIRSRHFPPPSIRDFVHRHFLTLASKGKEYEAPDVRSRLQRETNNITSVLADALGSCSEVNLPEIVDVVICFCHYTYISGNGSTQIIADSIKKLEEMAKPKKTTISSSTSEIKGTSRSKSIWSMSFGPSGKSKSSKALVQISNAEEVTTGTTDIALSLRANCFGCWGQILSRQFEFALAKEKFESALELHKQSGDLSGRAYDLLNIGLLLSRDPDGGNSLDVLQEAFDLHEQLQDTAGKAYDLLALGHAYRDLTEFDEARDSFASAARLFSEIGDKSGRASTLNGLGNLLLSLSNFSEAEEYFTEAANLSQDIGDQVGEAESTAFLSVTLLLRSRFFEAHKMIQKAISLRHPFVDVDHIHILGRVCIALQEYEKAEIHLLNSLAYHEETGDYRGEAEDRIYLAFIEFHRGNYHKARRLCDQASETASIIKNESLEAESLLLVEQLWLRTADSSSGIFLGDTADTFKRLGCKLGQAGSMYVAGIANLRSGSCADALSAFTQALNLHAEVGNIQGQADDLNKICEALLLSGSPDEAIPVISEAMALHIKINDKEGQADDMYIQGAILSARNRLIDAEAVIKRALEMHEALNSPYSAARDYALLSDIIWQQHCRGPSVSGKQSPGRKNSRLSQALLYIDKAIKLFRKVRALGELYECKQQQRRILRKGPKDPDSWRIDSEDEEEEE